MDLLVFFVLAMLGACGLGLLLAMVLWDLHERWIDWAERRDDRR